MATEVTYVFPATEKIGTSRETLVKTRTIPTSTPENMKLESVGYAVMAASIQPELGTNTFSVTVTDGVTPVTKVITLQKALPTVQELVAVFNEALANAFANHTEPAPVMITSNGGYVIRVISTTETATFEFSETAVVLWFSDPAFAPAGTLTILPGADSDVFYPSPRLGAQFQQLALAGGSTGGIKLPLTGRFMTPIIYYPPAGSSTGVGGLGQTARVITHYPAVDRTIEENPLTRTAFVITIRQ